MTTTQAFDWSPRAQAWRVIMQDARVTGVDAAFSLFYVISGFLILPPDSDRTVDVVSVPFVMLSLVLLYLLVRICGPDCDNSTATFYANLPRGRMLSFRTHVAWLCMLTLALEAAIYAGVALRLGATRPGQVFMITPYMFVLPFFVIAFSLWCTFGDFKSYVLIPTVGMTTLLVGSLIALDTVWRIRTKGAYDVSSGQKAAAAGILAVLTIVLLWHADRRWARTQIGALA